LSVFDFKNFIGDNQEETTKIEEQILIKPEESHQQPQPDLAPENRFFDADQFVKELYVKTTKQNKERTLNQKYMSSYDVSTLCIANVLYKLRDIPIKNYANRWAPITLRGYIGSSIHDFIQENSNQFTEQEVSLKIPSIRYSGRLDCMINNNVLVEIKSLPYNDYRKIVKTRTPRINDFYQTLSYKYILENYLEEARTNTEVKRTPGPGLDYYKIDYIQFIYIAHDILASDVESLDEAISIVSQVKKALNSKHNTFYFMSNLLLDLSQFDLTAHMSYVTRKIERINYYMDNNLDVASDDEFLDNGKCFFCLFGEVCPYKKRK
jgi:hypothetical protein